jgi:hypothetical protein
LSRLTPPPDGMKAKRGRRDVYRGRREKDVDGERRIQS